MVYWALQLLGWSLYFYAQASGEALFGAVPWSQAATLWGLASLANVALTHGLRVLIARRRWLALPPSALTARMIAATLVVAALAGAVTALLAEAIYGTPVAPLYSAFYEKLEPAGQLRNQSIAVLVITVAWVALYLAFAMQRHRYRAELRQAQLGEALQVAELRLLRSQLNPHFLFNALNGLRSLIADEPERAREAVTRLARLLRYTLAAGEDDRVSLARELELVDDYLALESLRLADRLRVDKHVAPEAMAVTLPAMSLQSLVENAIKHGIAAMRDGGTLRISASVREGELLLEVVNPRPHDAGPANEAGVGIRNAVARLRLLFGDRARLDVDLHEPGMATARMRVPA